MLRCSSANLIIIATALMLLIIVPVMILIGVFAWRYRASNKDATYDPISPFDAARAGDLVGAAADHHLPGRAHLVQHPPARSVPPAGSHRAGPPRSAKAKPLEIQVVAMDWKWLFIYPEQGIATVNELVLPVDVPVRFSMTSTSQMNTFYAPTLAGMIYAMPGMKSELHAVLNKPATAGAIRAIIPAAAIPTCASSFTASTKAGSTAMGRRREGLGRARSRRDALHQAGPAEREGAGHALSARSWTACSIARSIAASCRHPCIADCMKGSGHAPRSRRHGRRRNIAEP
jgi:cytochrome o ubiquinol oxidase subunit 2